MEAKVGDMVKLKDLASLFPNFAFPKRGSVKVTVAQETPIEGTMRYMAESDDYLVRWFSYPVKKKLVYKGHIIVGKDDKRVKYTPPKREPLPTPEEEPPSGGDGVIKGEKVLVKCVVDRPFASKEDRNAAIVAGLVQAGAPEDVSRKGQIARVLREGEDGSVYVSWEPTEHPDGWFYFTGKGRASLLKKGDFEYVEQ